MIFHTRSETCCQQKDNIRNDRADMVLHSEYEKVKSLWYFQIIMRPERLQFLNFFFDVSKIHVFLNLSGCKDTNYYSFSFTFCIRVHSDGVLPAGPPLYYLV